MIFIRLIKTRISAMILIFGLLLILSAACATQHKYKKYKAIPCPCEKENKR